MNESGKTRNEADFPQARQRRTRWPGWVWLIPLVALAFAAWLAVQEWVVGPHPISVHFASVEGIKPGAPVRYKGVEVGSVDKIELDDDLQGTTLVLNMTSLGGQLGEGTKVWIVHPSIAPGQISGLISGAYLAIAPGAKGEVDELIGLESPPIIVPEGPGRSFVLTTDSAEGIDAGAPVRFHGIEVGRVLGKRFAKDGSIEVPVFVRGDYAQLVRQATVFWRAGGFDVSKGPNGLSIDFPSFAGLTVGAVGFDTPEVFAGAVADAGATFRLYDKRDDAATSPTGPRLAYAMTFAQPVGGLGEGAAVTLGGKEVGRVASTDIGVAPNGNGLVTPVRIVIDSRKMGLDLGKLGSREALRQRMNEVMAQLVQAGMHAQVAEGGIVFGGKSIELALMQNIPPGQFDASAEPPLIPTASGNAGGYGTNTGGQAGAAKGGKAGAAGGGNAGAQGGAASGANAGGQGGAAGGNTGGQGGEAGGGNAGQGGAAGGGNAGGQPSGNAGGQGGAAGGAKAGGGNSG